MGVERGRETGRRTDGERREERGERWMVVNKNQVSVKGRGIFRVWR